MKAWKWLKENVHVLRMLGALLVLAVSLIVSYISLNSTAYAESHFVNKSDYRDDKAFLHSRLDRMENKIDDINTYLRKGQ